MRPRLKVQRLTSERHKWRGICVSADQEEKPTAFILDERKYALSLMLTGKDIQQIWERESTFSIFSHECFCDASAASKLDCCTVLIHSEVGHWYRYGAATLHPFPSPIISWVTDNVCLGSDSKGNILKGGGGGGHMHRDALRWKSLNKTPEPKLWALATKTETQWNVETNWIAGLLI